MLNFFQWLTQDWNLNRKDNVGNLARDAVKDKTFESLRGINQREMYLLKNNCSPTALGTLRQAYDEFKNYLDEEKTPKPWAHGDGKGLFKF